MNDFLSKARALAGNPLGIIALFIALIYGFATALLGTTAKNLSEDERLPLIWFVVLFPVLVLAVFYVLVARHHGKLYAPGDYKTDESFLKTLTAQEQEAKLQEEVATLQPNAEAQLETSSTPQTPDLKSNSRTEDIRSLYARAERLALDTIRREHQLNIQESVAIGDGPQVAFDGAAETDAELILIETKFLRHSWIPADRVREILYRGVLAHEFLRRRGSQKKVRLIIAFVVQGEVQRTRFEALMQNLLKDAPIPVEWRLLSLTGLEAAAQEA